MRSIMKKIIGILLMSFSCIASATNYGALVPGETNPLVTQANIKQTICVSGWTKTIRPSASYTNKLKAKQIKQFGLTGAISDYEEDHLISLEIGGNPTSEKNLWPQLWVGDYNAHMKDQLENSLKREVCTGKITLLQAQSEVSKDWIAAYNKRFHKK